MRLTEHFHADEFRCKCRARGLDTDDAWCHGEVWVHRELVERLQKLRDRVGKPVFITSGCRCPSYNAYVGGARKSQHKRGTAADIVVKGVPLDELEQVAREVGFTWTKPYPEQGFLHVDVRGLI